jgi:hypothetical protein
MPELPPRNNLSIGIRNIQHQQHLKENQMQHVTAYFCDIIIEAVPTDRKESTLQ